MKQCASLCFLSLFLSALRFSRSAFVIKPTWLPLLQQESLVPVAPLKLPYSSEQKGWTASSQFFFITSAAPSHLPGVYPRAYSAVTSNFDQHSSNRSSTSVRASGLVHHRTGASSSHGGYKCYCRRYAADKGPSEVPEDNDADHQYGEQSSSSSSNEGKSKEKSIGFGDTVTKLELASALAAASKLTKTDVLKVVEVLPKTILKFIAKGRKVNLTKMGAFGAKLKPARTAVNPRTRAPVSVAEKLSPTFSFFKSTKEWVKQQRLKYGNAKPSTEQDAAVVGVASIPAAPVPKGSSTSIPTSENGDGSKPGQLSMFGW